VVNYFTILVIFWRKISASSSPNVKRFNFFNIQNMGLFFKLSDQITLFFSLKIHSKIVQTEEKCQSFQLCAFKVSKIVVKEMNYPIFPSVVKESGSISLVSSLVSFL